jgi:flagellin-like protein
MKGKGVSPVIATVLLIAMVIVIALIVFLWFKNLGGETLTKMGGQNVEIVCTTVEFSAEYIDPVLTVANQGNVPIYDINIKIEYDGSHETKKISEVASNWGPLKAGGSFVGALSVSGTPSSFVLSPILLATSDEGEKTYECDENKAGKEIVVY